MMTVNFKHLQVGQTVAVEDRAFGFHLTVVSEEQPGPKVAAVGVDYVVLEDAAAGVKTRLPMHVIHSVTAPIVMAPMVAATTVTATPMTAPTVTAPVQIAPDTVDPTAPAKEVPLPTAA